MPSVIGGPEAVGGPDGQNRQLRGQPMHPGRISPNGFRDGKPQQEKEDPARDAHQGQVPRNIVLWYDSGLDGHFPWPHRRTQPLDIDNVDGQHKRPP